MINGLFYNLVTKLLIVIIEHVNKQDMKYRREIFISRALIEKRRRVHLSRLSSNTYIYKFVKKQIKFI